MMVRRGITILLAVLVAVSAVTVVSAKSGGVTLNCNSQNITWCSQPPTDK